MANNGHSFSAYFKRATSPLVVLQLLKERAMYVYEISQAMKKKSNGRFTIETLYPVLYRLEEQGYVAMTHIEVIDNRARSYYAITEKGIRYLSQSLQAYQKMHHTFMTFVEEDDI